MNQFTAIACVVLVATAATGWLYVDHLQGRVDGLVRERDQAVAQRDAAQRAIAELAIENAIASRRSEIVAAGRESIIAAPATDDGPIAPVLQQAMDAANLIGGIQ